MHLTHKNSAMKLKKDENIVFPCEKLYMLKIYSIFTH